MAFSGLYLLLFSGSVLLIHPIYASNYCETCECTISEESSDVRAVRTVSPVCDSGQFSWYNVYGGALRIIFRPRFPGPFQLCLTVEAENSRVRVFQELSQSPSPYRLFGLPPSLKPVASVDGKTDEQCISSSTDSITLYLESERTVKSTGFSFVKIYFSMEEKNEALFYDPLEECRPCTDAELITAFCEHDNVVIGSMASVENHGNQTHINIHISRVIRKRMYVFDSVTTKPYVTETMTRHKKCQVKKGPGDFLFTGTRRLGTLKLTCSPYLKDWDTVAQRAIHSGTMKCPL